MLSNKTLQWLFNSAVTQQENVRNVIVAVLPVLSDTAGNQEHLTFTYNCFNFSSFFYAITFIRIKVGEAIV